MLKLLAFVLPLGLDSFAVAAALGASQVSTVWQRLRISLVFVIFEGGMPLIGLALGSALARGIGHIADYLAAAAVIGIGVWMLLADNEEEEDKAGRIMTSRGLALVGLGISISLDQAASQREAMPWPTPMHMVAAPRAVPRRCISCSKVVTIRAPEQPSGWPMAIAPPLTLTRPGSALSSSTTATDWAANASLISSRPTSSSRQPARPSALCMAGTGPIPL